MALEGALLTIGLGVVGLLDRKTSHRFSADGVLEEPHPRVKVWIVLAFIFGGVSALFGAWNILSSVANHAWFDFSPLYWLSWLASGVVQAGLGALIVVSGWRKRAGLPSVMAGLTRVLSIAALAAGAWLVVWSVISQFD